MKQKDEIIQDFSRHEPVVEQCEGCDRISPTRRCFAYYSPKYKWEHGGCLLHPSKSAEARHTEQKSRKGQQKQAKLMRLSPKQQETYRRLGEGR